MTYKQWDTVVVPFPFVDAPKSKRRPVAVISGNRFNEANQHVIAAMITSVTHQHWQGDVTIEDLESAGLHAPCLIRLKLFTLDQRIIASAIGSLGKKDREQLQKALSGAIGQLSFSRDGYSSTKG